MTAQPSQLTGQIFVEGQPQDVTGFLVRVHHAGDWTSGTSLAIVDLLTPEGVEHHRAFVLAFRLLGVKVKSLANFSEKMLWHVADIDWHGFGEFAFAELSRREALEIAETQRIRRCELDRSRRSADALMGR